MVDIHNQVLIESETKIETKCKVRKMNAIFVKTVSSEVPIVYRNLLCKYSKITKPPNLHDTTSLRRRKFHACRPMVLVARRLHRYI